MTKKINSFNEGKSKLESILNYGKKVLFTITLGGLIGFNAYAKCPNAEEFWKNKNLQELPQAVEVKKENNEEIYKLNLNHPLGNEISKAMKECYGLGEGIDPEKIIIKNNNVEIYSVDIKEAIPFSYEKGTRELLNPELIKKKEGKKEVRKYEEKEIEEIEGELKREEERLIEEKMKEYEEKKIERKGEGKAEIKPIKPKKEEEKKKKIKVKVEKEKVKKGEEKKKEEKEKKPEKKIVLEIKEGKEEYNRFIELKNKNNFTDKEYNVDLGSYLSLNEILNESAFALIPYLNYKRIDDAIEINSERFGLGAKSNIQVGKILKEIDLKGELGFSTQNQKYRENRETENSTLRISQDSTNYGFNGGIFLGFKFPYVGFGLGFGFENNTDEVKDITLEEKVEEENLNQNGINILNRVWNRVEVDSDLSIKNYLLTPQIILESNFGNKKSKEGNHKIFLTYSRVIRKNKVDGNIQVDINTNLHTEISYNEEIIESDENFFETNSYNIKESEGDILHQTGLVYNFSKGNGRMIVSFNKIIGEKGSEAGRDYNISARGIIPLPKGILDVYGGYKDNVREGEILFLKNNSEKEIENYGDAYLEDKLIDNYLFFGEETRGIIKEKNKLKRLNVKGWRVGGFMKYDKTTKEDLKLEIGIKGGYSKDWFVYGEASQNIGSIYAGGKIKNILLGGKVEYKRNPKRKIGYTEKDQEHNFNAEIFVEW